jgi:hypothetical protein
MKTLFCCNARQTATFLKSYLSRPSASRSAIKPLGTKAVVCWRSYLDVSQGSFVMNPVRLVVVFVRRAWFDPLLVPPRRASLLLSSAWPS